MAAPFTLNEREHYFTCLHEAAHIVAVHRSSGWKLSDPLIKFGQLGNLAQAHFGPRDKDLVWTPEIAREFAIIGFAGYHGQNLDDHTGVLDGPMSGCEFDFERVATQLDAVGLLDEAEVLLAESGQLIKSEQSLVRRVATCIYENGSSTDLPLSKVLFLLSPATNSGKEIWKRARSWVKFVFRKTAS